MRNSIVGIKPTVGLTSRAGNVKIPLACFWSASLTLYTVSVVPESSHQDSTGTFARTVRDAVYALDAIYGVDSRDNYTSAQIGHTPSGGYAQFLSTQTALEGAKFGIPWDSFWKHADAAQQVKLTAVIEMVRAAGATVINGTELPNRDTIVSPRGWNWDYGSTRGFANESEYTVIKVDFYNDIKAYLAELDNTEIRSLEDIVQYNKDNSGSEGGTEGVHPAFASGQDGFLASLETGGVMDETYYQALAFCQKSTREDGIDAALYNNGNELDALFIPPDVAQAPQIAAQAGYPIITLPVATAEESGMGYSLGLMGTAWLEAVLVKYASAIEDLKKNTEYVRTLPGWRDYKVRNLPVPF
jgi:amidase